MKSKSRKPAVQFAKYPIPPGWKGGFEASNKDFSYPKPDLSSLPMKGNMDNIDLLQRQLGVKWPEFSWEFEKGNADTRVYQMFAPYISRVGYTDTGRVYSIICPQQGLWLLDEICLNVEITVVTQRGWANESSQEYAIAADMTVEAKVWFSPSEKQGDKFNKYWPLLQYVFPRFPWAKKNAIRIPTYRYGGTPSEHILPVRAGKISRFKSPGFALHEKEAFTVANVEATIGEYEKINDDHVDEFNEMVIEAFNLGSGNLLQSGNVLSWNVWFSGPELVNQCEWRTHAERWRHSIDTHHGYPDGPGTRARYFNGKYFNSDEHAIEEIIEKILKYLEDKLKKIYGEL